MHPMHPHKRFMSFVYAFRGIKYLFASQPNMWIHAVAAVLVIAAGVYVQLSPTHWAIIIICIGTVLAAEAFNSAIEWLTDGIFKEIHPDAAKIKDVSAAAVLIIALMAATAGVLVFYPYMLALVQK